MSTAPGRRAGRSIPTGVLALLLPVAGCSFFTYTSPFDNPVDPGLQYSWRSSSGVLEYADGRGVRLPQDLDVSADGSALYLVPSGGAGYGIVDVATGELSWGGGDAELAELCVDASTSAIYASWGGELFSIDPATGDRTLLHGEYCAEGYAQDGYLIYAGLAVLPGGEVAGLLSRGWPGDDGSYRYSNAIHLISSEGELRLSIEIGEAGGTDVALSGQHVFLSRDGIITLYDPLTGIAYGTISRDDATGAILRRVYPDLPGSSFGAAYLCFDAGSGYLYASSSSSDAPIPACYVLDPELQEPLVDTLGSSTDIPNGLLAVGPDGTVYGAPISGSFVEDLATGTVLFQNPPRVAGEYRGLAASVFGDDGLLYLLDRDLRLVDSYDPGSGTFAALSLPAEGETGALTSPAFLAEGASRLFIADGTTIRSYDLSGAFVEEWLLPDPSSVWDLDCLADGRATVVGAGSSGLMVIYLLTPGDSVPLSSSLWYLPMNASSVTGGAVAVGADGEVVLALSGAGVAYWGYLDVGTTDTVYEAVWDWSTDALLSGGTIDGSRYRIDGAAVGPACAWVSFPELGALVRYSPEGTVLGSFNRTSGGWVAGSIDDLGFSDSGVFAVDSQARLWLRYGSNTVWLVTPY